MCLAQRYDDDGPGLLAGPRDEARKAEEKKRADRAKAAKALKLKKAKVFRCGAMGCLLIQQCCDSVRNLLGTLHACAQHKAAPFISCLFPAQGCTFHFMPVPSTRLHLSFHACAQHKAAPGGI